MYAQVFKDSSASIKAWVVRAKAKKPKIEFMDGGEWKLHKDMGYSGTLKAEYLRRLSRIFKDSSAATKAWLSRARNNTVSEGQLSGVSAFMAGFTAKVKNPNERDYTRVRVQQLLNGTPRGAGMSTKFGMTRQRAAQYEELIYRVYVAAKAKHNVD